MSPSVMFPRHVVHTVYDGVTLYCPVKSAVSQSPDTQFPIFEYCLKFDYWTICVNFVAVKSGPNLSVA